MVSVLLSFVPLPILERMIGYCREINFCSKLRLLWCVSFRFGRLNTLDKPKKRRPNPSHGHTERDEKSCV